MNTKKKAKTPQTLDTSLIQSYIDEMQGASVTAIAKAIREDLKLDMPLKAIKQVLNTYSENEATEQELFTIEYSGYFADSINAYILHNRERFIVSLETIGKIMCAYTYEGLKLTKTQTSKLLRIPPKTVGIILSKIGITKDSSIVLKPIIDHFNEQFHNDFIKECMKKVLEEVPKQSDPIKDTVFDSYKKAMLDYKVQQRDLSMFLKQLGEHAFKAVNVKPVSVQSSKTVSVVITDVHFGCKSDIYSKDTIVEKLGEIQDQLIRRYDGYKVHVLMLGDIFHSITGLKHTDIWKDIEDDIYGANAFIEAAEVFVGFLSKVQNLASVNIVGGNHDSFTPNIKDEPSSEGSKLFAYMLEKGLATNNVTVNYDPHLVKYDHENINIIGIHGDQASGKMSATELAWKFGDNKKFNLILMGHKHCRTIAQKDDQATCRKIGVTAFSPADAYAKRNGWSNLSGYLLIEGKDHPTVVDIPLIY